MKARHALLLAVWVPRLWQDTNVFAPPTKSMAPFGEALTQGRGGTTVTIKLERRAV